MQAYKSPEHFFLQKILIKNTSKRMDNKTNKMTSFLLIQDITLLRSIFSHRSWPSTHLAFCRRIFRTASFLASMARCRAVLKHNTWMIIAIPRFDSFYMKNSIAHRGSIVWNNLMSAQVANTASNIRDFTRLTWGSKFHQQGARSNSIHRHRLYLLLN